MKTCSSAAYRLFNCDKAGLMQILRYECGKYPVTFYGADDAIILVRTTLNECHSLGLMGGFEKLFSHLDGDCFIPCPVYDQKGYFKLLHF